MSATPAIGCLQQPGFLIIFFGARMQRSCQSVTDHSLLGQVFKCRVQLAESIKVFEYGLHNMVYHVIRDTGGADDGGTDTEGSDIIRIPLIHPPGITALR